MASLTCLIQHSPAQGHHSYSAYKFCEAALRQGHTITQVFFYGDAVAHGHCLATQHSDEVDVQALWQGLAEHHSVSLVICATVAARHGIYPADALTDPAQGNLAEHFSAGGLAEYIEAVATSDRLVQF